MTWWRRLRCRVGWHRWAPYPYSLPGAVKCCWCGRFEVHQVLR
jgi:hypothetical protein